MHLLLYGPPASGKTSITRLLHELDSTVTLFPTYKIGNGSCEDYRFTTEAHYLSLKQAKQIVFANRRYNNKYFVDLPTLTKLQAADKKVVLHIGGVSKMSFLRLRKALPEKWLFVELQNSLEVCKKRTVRRGDEDVAKRLATWERMAQFAGHHPDYVRCFDLTINTDIITPQEAAQQIYKHLL
jgi:guanylate kinase